MHIAANQKIPCCSRLVPSSNSLCQRYLSNSQAVNVQDYSLLRDGTTSRDVFTDVEGGKKRSASALRLLGLAKAEALVRPACCPLREPHARRLSTRSADARALCLCLLKALRALMRTLRCCSAGAACGRGELHESGVDTRKNTGMSPVRCTQQARRCKPPDGVRTGACCTSAVWLLRRCQLWAKSFTSTLMCA
jgi:hypothetical protein